MGDTPADELKSRVHDFWQANPCGAKFAKAEIGSREFFETIERHRYETEWHIPEVVGFDRWRGLDVLEVGCGAGTDGVNFARAGANYRGVDLTDRSIELVRRRFELEGLPAQMEVADAERLPFPDSGFDLVYSHGVLHHTPDTQRAVNEVYRVLKPGGTAMVMLYHKNSYNYYINIMTLRRLGVRLLKFGWGPAVVRKLTGEEESRLRDLQKRYRQSSSQLLDRQEFLNQNTDGAGNPLARVYTRSDAEVMFRQFHTVRTEVHFLNKRWIPLVGAIMPRWMERKLARLAGWHLWIIAQR